MTAICKNLKMSYARVLAQYPYVILLAVFVLVATCLILSTTVIPLPSFSDPMAGFVPRGTELGDKLLTYQNLVDNKGNKLTPMMYTPYHHDNTDDNRNDDLSNDEFGGSSNDSFDPFIKKEFTPTSYFCPLPGSDYKTLSRVVFQRIDKGTLLDAKHIKYMCTIVTDKIQSHATFPDLCLRDDNGHCCRSWSLGNYIAFLSNKTSCSQVTDQDVLQFTHLLKKCSVFYQNFTLTHNCDDTLSDNRLRCPDVPHECVSNNAIYDIFHYIIDIESFHSLYKRQTPMLNFAVTYLPFPTGPSTIGMFRHIESWIDTLQEVKIAGAHFGIKADLFNEYIRKDTMWLIASGCVIFTIIWIYTASIFIAVMTFLMMFWSLEVSYFFYTMIFEVSFFPYMNLVTVIIVIALGADDVFLYTKVWQSAKAEPNNGTLEKIISDTLKHATMSMFVTSFTTAAALFTNAVSSITAIKCFSIYAGTTVLCNFILVVTWLPAAIVIYEKWCNCEMWYSPDFSSEKNVCYYICKLPYSLYQKITEFSKFLFENLLPRVVIKLRFLWIFLFSLCGISGIIVIFFYPKLKLPSSEKFQVFSSDHPLEKYDFVLYKKFWFEQKHKDQFALLPLTIVWGVLPTDTGNRLDPFDTGQLKWDLSFDPTTFLAQKWLLQFCDKVRSAKFYQDIPGFQLTSCFFDEFQNLMGRPCYDFMAERDLSPCCNATSQHPLSADALTKCLEKYMMDLALTPHVRLNHFSPGLRFDFIGNIRALIVEFYSSTSFSFSYQQMNQFYANVNTWMTEELNTAPKEIGKGFFISELDFFSLQKCLLEETPVALGVSILVVSFVIFLTTLNLLISFLAIISIAFVMFSIIGAIVLIGWELNILESVIITVAIGMSVDYTLHYAVSYRLMPDMDNKSRVKSSMARVGSVIFMAGVTTFLAGLMMMPSTVLVYQKFGIFLMLTITISWAYSTLFFQSLLSVLGPRGNCGQFHWPSCDCCVTYHEVRHDKTIYSTSESTVSTSSSFYHTTSSSEVSRDVDSGLEMFDHRAHSSRPRRHSSKGFNPSYRHHRRRDSPEPPVRRGSRVRFSFSSIEKSVSVFDEEEDLPMPPHSRSRAESEVFIEKEEEGY